MPDGGCWSACTAVAAECNAPAIEMTIVKNRAGEGEQSRVSSTKTIQFCTRRYFDEIARGTTQYQGCSGLFVAQGFDRIHLTARRAG